MSVKVLQVSTSPDLEFNVVDAVAPTDTLGGSEFTGSAGSLALATTGVTAGTYTSVTVDSKGRVTAGTNPGGGSSVPSVTATNSSGSTIAANTAVNLYDGGGGVLTMRLADSGTTNNYPVTGFTTASVANGATGSVQLADLLSGFTSLTIGTYYSDIATPGGITATAPTTSNAKLQKVGFAVSATQLMILPHDPIKLA